MNTEEKRESVSQLLDIYGSLLTDNQKDCVDLYYNEDLSLSEIAENYGITRQGVRDTIQHAVKRMESYDEALDLRRHYAELNSAIDEIKTLSVKIKEVNSDTALSMEINDAATRINTIVQMLDE